MKKIIIMGSLILICFCMVGIASLRQVTTTNIINASDYNHNNLIRFELSETNETLTTETLTFTGTQSYIRYITIPSHANITYAAFNITNSTPASIFYNVSIDIGIDGIIEFNQTPAVNKSNMTINGSAFTYFLNSPWIYQETANVSNYFFEDTGLYACDGVWVNLEAPSGYCQESKYLFDGDWSVLSSASSDSGFQKGEFWINYTKPNRALNSSLWQVKDFAGTANLTIPQLCWDQEVLQFYLQSYADNPRFAGNWSCWNGNLWQKLRGGTTSNYVSFVEEAMWWKIDTDDNGNYNIPINITAQDGTMRFDAINITYDYNITHLFERNNTYTWNETNDIVVGNIYKRRYSVRPTSDVAENTINLTGYYSNQTSITECAINNTVRSVTSGYCEFKFNITQGSYWPTHYIWDSNITNETAVNLTNINKTRGNYSYLNYTLTYRNPDNITIATANYFTNTTLNFYYNSNITTGHTLEVFNSGTWYDISLPIASICTATPSYTRTTANSRTFHVCFDSTNKYISLKIEESI